MVVVSSMSKAKAKQTVLMCCGEFAEIDEYTVHDTDQDGSWSLGPMECKKCGTMYDIQAMPPTAMEHLASDVDTPPEDYGGCS
jgi:hypothetical protein